MDRRRLTLAALLTVAWMVAFARSLDGAFWWVMGALSLVILAIGVASDPALSTRVVGGGLRGVVVGLVAGVALAASAHVVARLAPTMWPALADEVRALVARLHVPPGPRAGFPLLVLIAVAEDVLWRDLFPRGIGGRPHLAHVVATLVYAGAQAVQRSPLVVATALGVGAVLATLTVRTGALTAALVAHLVFDVLVFVLFPLT